LEGLEKKGRSLLQKQEHHQEKNGGDAKSDNRGVIRRDSNKTSLTEERNCFAQDVNKESTKARKNHAD